MIAVTLAVELLLMTLSGVFIQKRRIVGDTFPQQLSSFVMRFLLPMLVFNSVANAIPFSAELLNSCMSAVILGFFVMLLSLCIGQLLSRFERDGGMGRILRYSITFPHFSFMGIPVVDTLFGDVGTLYYVFFMVPVRLFYYALSEPFMTPPELKKQVSALDSIQRALLNPSMLAIAFGLVCWISGWQLPTVLNYVVVQCASICSPLALILCGMTLGKFELKKVFSLRYFKAPILRLTVMPGLFFLLTRPLSLLHVDSMLCSIVVIFTALPVASMLSTYTMQCDPSPENGFSAASVCVLSTLLSTLTIPVWYILLQRL